MSAVTMSRLDILVRVQSVKIDDCDFRSEYEAVLADVIVHSGLFSRCICFFPPMQLSYVKSWGVKICKDISVFNIASKKKILFIRLTRCQGSTYSRICAYALEYRLPSCTYRILTCRISFQGLLSYHYGYGIK